MIENLELRAMKCGYTILHPKPNNGVCTVVHLGEALCKKAKDMSSVGKVMGTVFWDQKGILLCEYMPKGMMINGATHQNILTKLRAAIWCKMPGLTKGSCCCTRTCIPSGLALDSSSNYLLSSNLSTYLRVENVELSKIFKETLENSKNQKKKLHVNTLKINSLFSTLVMSGSEF